MYRPDIPMLNNRNEELIESSHKGQRHLIVPQLIEMFDTLCADIQSDIVKECLPKRRLYSNIGLTGGGHSYSNKLVYKLVCVNKNC